MNRLQEAGATRGWDSCLKAMVQLELPLYEMSVDELRYFVDPSKAFASCNPLETMVHHLIVERLSAKPAPKKAPQRQKKA